MNDAELLTKLLACIAYVESGGNPLTCLPILKQAASRIWEELGPQERESVRCSCTQTPNDDDPYFWDRAQLDFF